MEYLVYKTTHRATGKFYIGVHRTENRDDGYLGSGAANKGSVWIKHTETHQCKKVQQHELTQYLAKGWARGRIGWKNKHHKQLNSQLREHSL